MSDAGSRSIDDSELDAFRSKLEEWARGLEPREQALVRIMLGRASRARDLDVEAGWTYEGRETWVDMIDSVFGPYVRGRPEFKVDLDLGAYFAKEAGPSWNKGSWVETVDVPSSDTIDGPSDGITDDDEAIAAFGRRVDRWTEELTSRERLLLGSILVAAMDPIERVRWTSDASLLDEGQAELLRDLDETSTREGMSHLSLVVKATRLCNLRCAYCNDWRAGPDQTMTFDVLAHLLAKALRDPSHHRVEICWHGGEPTVLPIDWYRRALLIESRFRRPGQVIRNSLQSNGTRFTPAWARFLREGGFDVSISIDGPPEVHNELRVYVSGRPSFDDVARNVDLLRRHGIDVGILMVVDEATIARGPRRLFDFMLRFGAHRYGLLAAMPPAQPDGKVGTPTPHFVEPGRMTEFLAGLYDCWRAQAGWRPRIRELHDIEQRLVDQGSVTCTFAGGCIGQLYSVEPNGDVNHCDEFIGDPRYVVGNVVRHDFTDIRRSSALQTLRVENDAALERMRSCPEFAVCNGWCPHERYLGARHDPNHRTDCCGLRDLIGHVRAATDKDGGVAITPPGRRPRLARTHALETMAP